MGRREMIWYNFCGNSIIHYSLAFAGNQFAKKVERNRIPYLYPVRDASLQDARWYSSFVFLQKNASLTGCKLIIALDKFVKYYDYSH